jgi:hypothetical protein
MLLWVCTPTNIKQIRILLSICAPIVPCSTTFMVCSLHFVPYFTNSLHEQTEVTLPKEKNYLCIYHSMCLYIPGFTVIYGPCAFFCIL